MRLVVEELSKLMTLHEPDRIALEVEEAYAEHGAALFAFSLRLCGNRDDAEDIVVETFAQAYRGWRTFRGLERRSWLFGIAVNRARTARRRHRPTVPLSEHMPQPGMNPMERIALEREIALLPQKQREAFLLIKSAGLSAREAADALGRPLGTVLYEVHKAIQTLRQALGDGLVPTTLLEIDA